MTLVLYIAVPFVSLLVIVGILWCVIRLMDAERVLAAILVGVAFVATVIGGAAWWSDNVQSHPGHYCAVQEDIACTTGANR